MREGLEATIRAHHDAGDHRAAVEEALIGYGRELMAFVCGRLRDEDAAGEVFSQVGEDIWKGIESFAWRSSFRTWMYVLARNAVSRFREGQARAGQRVNLSAVSDLVERHRTSTLAHLRTEAKDKLDELRAMLEPDDQTLLLLRVKRNLSWSDIALIMSGLAEMEGADLARAASRYRQRFQTLKRRLKEQARTAGLLDESG